MHNLAARVHKPENNVLRHWSEWKPDAPILCWQLGGRYTCTLNFRAVATMSRTIFAVFILASLLAVAHADKRVAPVIGHSASHARQLTNSSLASRSLGVQNVTAIVVVLVLVVALLFVSARTALLRNMLWWRSAQRSTPRALATFIERGRLLQAACQRGEDAERVRSLHAHWMSSAENYLAKTLGQSYAARFRTSRSGPLRTPGNRELSDIWADIGTQIDVLTAILAEIGQRA
jgi:hypothetical protein